MPLDILLLDMFKFLLKKKSQNRLDYYFIMIKKIQIFWLLDSFKINSQSPAYHNLYVLPPHPFFFFNVSGHLICFFVPPVAEWSPAQ